MRVVASERYELDIGLHVFPTAKYGALRAQALSRGLVAPHDLVEPAPASWDDLALVHTRDYLRKLQDGRLSYAEVAKLEIPWSPQIVEGFRLMTGGTLAAAKLACEDGLAFHVGGGFHHAFPDHGEGFCMFNDVAVALRVLMDAGMVRRAAVVDCDVHHGNGTAAIFAGDAAVFTFSMHEEDNYPAEKPPGSLDVHLPGGIGDEAYLSALGGALAQVLTHRPEVVAYLAGADPYRDDQLGGLGLTFDGLRRRDALVLRTCRDAGIPVFVTLAGGYARHVDDTIAIHLATLEEAAAASSRR